MMGVQDPPQGKLYYTNFNLDQRIRANHPLRRIAQCIDFDFVYKRWPISTASTAMSPSLRRSSSSSCCCWSSTTSARNGS